MPVQASQASAVQRPAPGASPPSVDIGVPSRWITPPVENSGRNSPTPSTPPKNELARLFANPERGETNQSFASMPTTTSNHGSRSTASNHGSGSNHGSRSGSSDGKHSNEDAADVSVEPTEDLRNTSFPLRPGTDETWAMPPLPQ